MILSNPFMVDPRVYKEAKSLVDAGHEITVIVWDRHEEYGLEDIVDGIRITRIRNEGIMKILPNDLLRNPLWWRKAYKKGLELYKMGEFRFDAVHCHDLDTLQAGVWLKKKTGCKLIFDSHELFAYMIKGNVPEMVVKYTLYMEKKLVRNVDWIITIDEPFKRYFKPFNKPITVVRNCKEIFTDEYQPPNNEVFTLLYIGIMEKMRFFPEILSLIESIDDIKLVLGGKKEALFEIIKEKAKNLENVEFIGTVKTENILPLTLNADATFVIVKPTEFYSRTLFNKQFEAMVCGRPIIVTKGTYAAKITEELNCGLTVEYNKNSIEEAILKLRDNPELCEELGRNALKAAKERYNWEIEKEKLLKVYGEII